MEYSVEWIEENILEKCEESEVFSDGVLGLGGIVCYMPDGRIAIVEEHFKTSWSSYHTVRWRKTLDKKTRDRIDEYYKSLEDED